MRLCVCVQVIISIRRRERKVQVRKEARMWEGKGSFGEEGGVRGWGEDWRRKHCALAMLWFCVCRQVLLLLSCGENMSQDGAEKAKISNDRAKKAKGRMLSVEISAIFRRLDS